MSGSDCPVHGNQVQTPPRCTCGEPLCTGVNDGGYHQCGGPSEACGIPGCPECGAKAPAALNELIDAFEIAVSDYADFHYAIQPKQPRPKYTEERDAETALMRTRKALIDDLAAAHAKTRALEVQVAGLVEALVACKKVVDYAHRDYQSLADGDAVREAIDAAREHLDALAAVSAPAYGAAVLGVVEAAKERRAAENLLCTHEIAHQDALCWQCHDRAVEAFAKVENALDALAKLEGAR